MNSVMPVVIIVMSLLLAGCAKPSLNETATAEQPAAPQPIRQPDLPKSTVPPPKPKKQIDPDTRDYDLTKTAPSSPWQEEQRNSLAPQTAPAPSPLIDLPAPSERVTASDQSESDKVVIITARIRQALIADEALSFRTKNAVIVTNHRQVVLQGRVSSHLEAEQIRDIASRMTTRPIENRLVVGQKFRVNN